MAPDFPPTPSSIFRRQLRAQLADSDPLVRAAAKYAIISLQSLRIRALLSHPGMPSTPSTRQVLHRHQLALSKLYIPLTRVWVWITCWRGGEERRKRVEGFTEYQMALDEASRRVLDVKEEDEDDMGRWELAGWAALTCVFGAFGAPMWIFGKVKRLVRGHQDA